MTDTFFAVDAGLPCTLWVATEGTGELAYTWYRDDNEIDAATDDSLMLDTVSINDTAHRWNCRITNPLGRNYQSGNTVTDTLPGVLRREQEYRWKSSGRYQPLCNG